MSKKIVYIPVALVLSALLFFGFSAIPTDEPQKVRFASIIPKDSPWELGINNYISKVETKTNNQLKFKTYFGGQLGGEVEMIKSVAMGSLEGGAFTLAAISEALSIPQLQVFEMPFLFNSDEEADYVMDKSFDLMSTLLDQKGLVLVMWGTNGWRSFGTKSKAIRTPEDMKGLKMRSQESDVYIEFYKSLGATPVPIATPEVLISLKTGMVDGYDQTPVFSLSTGWANSSKYFTVSNHIYQPGAIVMSKKFFEKLSSSNKEAVLSKAELPELQKLARSSIREEGKDILAMFPTFNIELIYLTKEQREAFKNTTKVVYEKMKPIMGKSIFKFIDIHLNKYRSTH